MGSVLFMTLYHVKMYFSTDMIPSVALGFHSVIVVGDKVLLRVDQTSYYER